MAVAEKVSLPILSLNYVFFKDMHHFLPNSAPLVPRKLAQEPVNNVSNE